jgi:hypothetical protein
VSARCARSMGRKMEWIDQDLEIFVQASRCTVTVTKIRGLLRKNDAAARLALGPLGGA